VLRTYRDTVTNAASGSLFSLHWRRIELSVSSNLYSTHPSSRPCVSSRSILWFGLTDGSQAVTMAFLDAFRLSLPTILGTAGGLWILYFVTSTYLSYRKLRHIKGPWLASISPLWMFYYTCRGELYLAVENALKKYGKEVHYLLLSAAIIF